MRFAVTVLRQKGVRLKREEIANAPVACGDLVIRDFNRGNAEGRALFFAQLLNTKPTFSHGLIVPIFEPHLIRMNTRWFILSGWQIELEDSMRKVEYRQEWLVRFPTPELEEMQLRRLNEQAERLRNGDLSVMRNK